MDRSTMLGVVGVVATIILGVYGIYVTLRRRYPGKLQLYVQDSIPLFESIVKNLPQLSIAYQDKPVDERLVLLKAVLANTGSVDITPAMVEEEITLSLPLGYRFLAVNVVSRSPSVSSKLAITLDNRAKVTTGLFRCGEFIRFWALIQTSPTPADEAEDKGDDVLEGLTIVHRIANTQRIRVSALAKSFAMPRRTKRRMYMYGGLLALGLALAAFTTIQGWPKRIEFEYLLPDGRLTRVSAQPMDSTRLRLRSSSPSVDTVVALDSFFLRNALKPHVMSDAPGRSIYVSGLLVYVVLPFLVVVTSFLGWRREKMLLRQFSEDPGSPSSES